jgi:type I restriction enzyme, S subunit
LRNWQYREDGMRFLNIRCISDGDIDIKKANCIDLAEFEKTYAHFALVENDVVISTSGTLGRISVVRKEHLPIMLNTSIIRMRERGPIGVGFLWSYLQSKTFLDEMLALAAGSVQLNFGPIHLRQMTLVKAPTELHRRYEQLIEPLIAKASDTKRNSSLLSALRDALLPALLKKGHNSFR